MKPFTMSRYNENRSEAMVENNPKTLVIDNVEYNLSDLSENSIAQIANIQFVDERIQQLNNEWAISDTARIGYENALRRELKDLTIKDAENGWEV